jgi:hypothetical protein
VAVTYHSASPMTGPDIVRFNEFIFPYAGRREQAIRNSGNRFVYYTSAEVALSMLRNSEIWLRNALLMNDFSEIGHGYACLQSAYAGEAGTTLKRALEKAYDGLSSEVETLFNDLVPTLYGDTYLMCLSEHCADEDMYGRLSMWRAYGGTTGVAVVINGAVMHSASDATGAYSSPVLYADREAFAAELLQVARSLDDETEFLRGIGREAVKNAIFEMLRFAALCTKHPGFKEELEWRVIASPAMYSPPRLRSAIEVVRGVPQKVLKIQLEDAPDEGLVGLSLPVLLDRIIVGPCAFPSITAMSFVEVLREIGVDRAGDRVTIADMPLRHSS